MDGSDVVSDGYGSPLRSLKWHFPLTSVRLLKPKISHSSPSVTCTVAFNFSSQVISTYTTCPSFSWVLPCRSFDYVVRPSFHCLRTKGPFRRPYFSFNPLFKISMVLICTPVLSSSSVRVRGSEVRVTWLLIVPVTGYFHSVFSLGRTLLLIN